MATKFSICHMRDTTNNWLCSTYVIPDGELVVEKCIDGGVKIKIGDGLKIFKDLPYVDLAETLTPADCGFFVQDTEPTKAEDGDVWIDTSI